jgi:ACS family glucarate transporter-like MFS transporter
MNNLPHPLEGPPGHVRWNILAVLVAMSFVAYVLRTNMSVAGESMMGELGLSQVELGMVLAAFAWGYALFQFPGGVFGDIFGPRRVLTWIAVCWGIANLAIGLVPGADLAGPGVLLVSLIALRFAMGVVQAPVFPVVAGTIRNWFPPGGWALPNALSNAGLTLGAAATGPLIAWLAVTVGWRLSFILTAPLGFVVALVWWRYGRDFPTEHPGVGDAESAFIKAGREPIVAEEPGAWKRVLRDRNVILLTVSYFCMNYVFYIFFNWFFIYLVQVRGFATLEGGFLATLPWLVGAVGAVIGGVWSDALSKSRGIRIGCRLPGIVSLVLIAGLLWAGAAATNAYLAVALLALCFGCTQLSDPAYWSAITSVGGRHTAAAAGVLNTGGNVVGGFGAILVPLVAERFGWVAALSTGSLMAVVAAVLWLFIRADEPLKT